MLQTFSSEQINELINTGKSPVSFKYGLTGVIKGHCKIDILHDNYHDNDAIWIL